MVGKGLPAIASKTFSIFLSRHSHPCHPERLWAMIGEGLPAIESEGSHNRQKISNEILRLRP